jgi:hypothetical protein
MTEQEGRAWRRELSTCFFIYYLAILEPNDTVSV